MLPIALSGHGVHGVYRQHARRPLTSVVVGRAFRSDKGKISEGEDAREDNQVIIVCGKDRKSRVCTAISVLQKGEDADGY